MASEPPDPSRYNASYIDSRRSFISDYLEHVGDDATAKWDDFLENAFEQVMESLEEQRLTQVSHDWLEYEADRVAWQMLFSELSVEAVEWPFTLPSEFYGPKMIAQGISPTYQKWRLDRGLHIHNVTFDEKPAVLSLDQRMEVWENDENYPREAVAPITGPFQIALPLWIDFYHLVLGENNHLLNMINNEIVPPHLAVSWTDDDEGCFTLIVGFSPTTCVNPGSEGIGHSIRYLWQSVVDWSTETYSGGTMSLATFLRVRKAMPFADASVHHGQGWNAWIREAYGDAQYEPMSFMRDAHKNRNFIAKCRDDVLEIIEKPLTEAKSELSRWVVYGGPDSESEERVRAAREIWVSSTTDERTIQEALIWAWGPHYMAI
ncbi:uncharacterized protein FFUJ_09023 [Fusarium fujikuroi IMI 58289]|uniref:Uncharacterized protein n=1 Tax=Gibberella fujikuroi (strain CBS 195.34 / IMI 58289 / NRRL A-6831) TaxID=1279085 RepID=S0E8J3_GIBF5|nr:uncharacterized protein FFUJ_09023 [Fusarium fujikuroi IMI 58289]KLP14344.1 uncharacterized protein LW94_6872 [Fusarium fujikuroi]QGI66668.1 hypothetical protein CEK27_010639 [Fusarium fujikuroi]QGI83907.1 hypothetical protein CEK25_010636 [Fusarium fujikuroi]QGI97558.1 hypothetical protein CEK26_010627 [Fusarium fujikuroi]CCT70950.1 uncharacterized protein FFUJ_09023 [Fusarium fujikuroi IMI 58289]